MSKLRLEPARRIDTADYAKLELARQIRLIQTMDADGDAQNIPLHKIDSWSVAPSGDVTVYVGGFSQRFTGEAAATVKRMCEEFYMVAPSAAKIRPI